MQVSSMHMSCLVLLECSTREDFFKCRFTYKIEWDGSRKSITTNDMPKNLKTYSDHLFNCFHNIHNKPFLINFIVSDFSIKP